MIRREHRILLAAATTACLSIGCRSAGSTAQPKATPPSTAKASAPKPEPSPPSAAASPTADPLHPHVEMQTTFGRFVIELNGEQAPATVLNFMQLVHDRYYDGTIIHRVLADSMVQGGGYTPDMESKPIKKAPPFTDTWRSDLLNKKGYVGLIRGIGEHLAAAEFYINVEDNIRLDEAKRKGMYSVFGRVVEGWDVIERIRATPVASHEKYVSGQSAVVPVTPIVIRSARVLGVFNTIPIQQSVYAYRTSQEEKAKALAEKFAAETGNPLVKTESGLLYVEMYEGKGMTPAVEDTVELNYEGKLLDGTVFESTFTEDSTIREPGKLIKGLRETLTSMKEGGRRVVIIPPELAFGESGIPGYIPPDSFLVFEIELLAIR